MSKTLFLNTERLRLKTILVITSLLFFELIIERVAAIKSSLKDTKVKHKKTLQLFTKII
jgi:hypothetical protein